MDFPCNTGPWKHCCRGVLTGPDDAQTNERRIGWLPEVHNSASGDATEAFEDVGHSTSAISMMSSYLIGSIEDYVPPSATKDATAIGSDVLPDSRTMQRNKGSPAPNTFLDFVLPLCMLGVAFAAWYYLTFVAES
ncbi:unnamed protein product [Triticum turgidum subsp. durum]|uniref:Cytochrome b5 heme-binding domain-containing protein n=1 Tax=Triticum turgidum subsp. durum TaxID=4567 RepID=A0A9R1C3U9_TRITD|nr:unnamed protein product [Triticum turgidum subsp. durum]